MADGDRRSRWVLHLATGTALVGCGADGVSPPPPPPPPAVATVEVTAPGGVVAAGETLQLTGTARDANGNPVSGASFTWSSTATTIASVDNSGLVKGVAAGSATITASSGGRSGSMTVAVRDTAALGATLSGRIERVRLTIPAGQTHRVTGDLTVLVDSVLDLAGALEVAPGVTVALFARRTLISGSIRPLGAQPLPVRWSSRGSARAGVPGRLVLTQHAFSLTGTVLASGPTFINGTGDGTATPATVVISGLSHLSIDRAPDGTAADRDGQDGFALEIGTAQGRAVAEAIAPGFSSAPVGQVDVQVTATVRAGGGGDGFSVVTPADGAVTGNLLRAVTGHGGEGGALVIEAGTVAFQGNVGAGSGGRAGEVGGSSGNPTNLSLRSGSGPAGEGEILEAVTGNGGTGGAVRVSAAAASGTVITGAPGWAPSVRVSGGNGANGGAGGLVQVDLGRAGSDGLVTVPAGLFVRRSTAFRSFGEVVVEDGLNGAVAPSAAKPGGEGGSIFVTRLGSAPPAGAEPTLRFTNVGNGGPGFNGCGAGLFGPGSDGGDGGTVDVGPEQPSLAGAFFNGGVGGSGFGVTGKGGGPGERAVGTTVTPVGNIGADGADCTGSALDVNPKSIAITTINTANLPNPCVPAPSGTSQVRIRNAASIPISVTMTITDQVGISGLTFEPTQGNPSTRTTTLVTVVPAQSTGATAYHHNWCTATNNFEASIRVVLSSSSTPVGVVPVTGTCTVNCKPGPTSGSPPHGPGSPSLGSPPAAAPAAFVRGTLAQRGIPALPHRRWDPAGATGLYHLAIRYPTRAAPADALRRLATARIDLDGASDHGVSEALYLRDPDANGVELYWDRPAEAWPRAADGSLAMVTRPLDLAGLLDER